MAHDAGRGSPLYLSCSPRGDIQAGVTHGETRARFPTIVGIAASPTPSSVHPELLTVFTSCHGLEWATGGCSPAAPHSGPSRLGTVISFNNPCGAVCPGARCPGDDLVSVFRTCWTHLGFIIRVSASELISSRCGSEAPQQTRELGRGGASSWTGAPRSCIPGKRRPPRDKSVFRGDRGVTDCPARPDTMSCLSGSLERGMEGLAVTLCEHGAQGSPEDELAAWGTPGTPRCDPYISGPSLDPPPHPTRSWAWEPVVRM